MRYSIFSLMRQALGGHRGWTATWRDAAPKPVYDVIIIGGGGHGLARHITWRRCMASRASQCSRRDGASSPRVGCGTEHWQPSNGALHLICKSLCPLSLATWAPAGSGVRISPQRHRALCLLCNYPYDGERRRPQCSRSQNVTKSATMRSAIDRDRSPWGVRNSCEARPPRLNGASPLPISKSARLPARFRAK